MVGNGSVLLLLGRGFPRTYPLHIAQAGSSLRLLLLLARTPLLAHNLLYGTHRSLRLPSCIGSVSDNFDILYQRSLLSIFGEILLFEGQVFIGRWLLDHHFTDLFVFLFSKLNQVLGQSLHSFEIVSFYDLEFGFFYALLRDCFYLFQCFWRQFSLQFGFGRFWGWWVVVGVQLLPLLLLSGLYLLQNHHF